MNVPSVFWKALWWTKASGSMSGFELAWALYAGLEGNPIAQAAYKALGLNLSDRNNK